MSLSESLNLMDNGWFLLGSELHPLSDSLVQHQTESPGTFEL